jgi:hypothetical protein
MHYVAAWLMQRSPRFSPCMTCRPFPRSRDPAERLSNHSLVPQRRRGPQSHSGAWEGLGPHNATSCVQGPEPDRCCRYPRMVLWRGGSNKEGKPPFRCGDLPRRLLGQATVHDSNRLPRKRGVERFGRVVKSKRAASLPAHDPQYESDRDLAVRAPAGTAWPPESKTDPRSRTSPSC